MMSDAVISLVGVVIGAGIASGASWALSHREWARRLSEVRLRAYSEWTAGMEDICREYASQTSQRSSKHDIDRCEKRLMLIEMDPVARKLVGDVRRSLPQLDTAEYASFCDGFHSDPEWDWPPFRKKMNELIAHVRATL